MKKLILLLSLISSVASAQNAEAILGYTYDGDGVAYQVNSGGCTRQEDFFIKQSKSNGYKTLTLYRRAEDPCLGYFPYGTQIYFSYDELDIEPGEKFRVVNTLETSRREIF